MCPRVFNVKYLVSIDSGKEALLNWRGPRVGDIVLYGVARKRKGAGEIRHSTVRVLNGIDEDH